MVYILSLEVIGSLFYKEVHEKAVLTVVKAGKAPLGHWGRIQQLGKTVVSREKTSLLALFL